ncbi:immunoglobulin superfamily member 8-like isoform X1 [Maylandia zebra]|uniref:immunoglobulin superfamily member 8-like isoform X1 n=1 Tax=Maylandia zebra TaxID=106582 RepID=UPI00403CA0C9
MENYVTALTFGIFMLSGCSARVVTVPPGPLIRVEGQPVSIRCDVKEYTGPSEQDFEWNMLKDAKGQKTKIISSFDSRYSDQSYSKRVASGDISVVRFQDNEVELKIAEVKLTDAGFYECQTPSTDYVISGNYMAQVQLTVIPNTLKVSPKTPPPVIVEGSDLTLSCNVTRELIHPTYLSVTWSVKKGTTSEEILTFGPEGDVVTGSRFAQRYAEGGIRLVPGRNGVFELVISKMTMSDEGNYECKGIEWTYERGRNWIKIMESTKEMGTVAVTPTIAEHGTDLTGEKKREKEREPVILHNSTPCYIVSSFLSLYCLIITSMFIREEFFSTKVKTNQDVNSELEGLDTGNFSLQTRP